MTELVYRPASLNDVELVTEMMTAAYPALVHDPVITRHRWEHPRSGFAHGRFVAEIDGRPAAFVAWVHGPWEQLPDRHCEIEVWLDRELLDSDLLTSLWTWIAEQAEAQGAGMLLAYAAEDELEALAVLASLGYERDRTEKVWELDMSLHGKRLVEEAKEARENLAGSEIELLTLAAWRDPYKLKKLHVLDKVTRQDVPHTLPIIPETFEDFERRITAPDRPHDRYWVALDGGRRSPCPTFGFRLCAARYGPATPARILNTAAAGSRGPSSCNPLPRLSSSAFRRYRPTTTPRMRRCSTSTSGSGTSGDRDTSGT